MGRRLPGGDQRGADGAILVKLLLQVVQRLEKRLEWTARQGLARFRSFRRAEGLQPLGLVDLLGLIGEKHRVAVEGHAQLARLGPFAAAAAQQQIGGRHALLQGLANVRPVGAEKQVAAEGPHVAVRTVAAAERSLGDIELVVLDGIEDAQPGVRRIAREQYDLNSLFFL